MQAYDLALGEARTDDEIKSLFHLFAKFDPRPESPEKFLEEVRKGQACGQHLLYAEIEGVKAGAIKTFFFNDPLVGLTAYVGGLIIDHAYRHSNIFHELLVLTEKHIRVRGVDMTFFGRKSESKTQEIFASKYGFQNMSVAYFKTWPTDAIPHNLKENPDIREVETEDDFEAVIPLLNRVNANISPSSKWFDNFHKARGSDFKLYALWDKKPLAVCSVHKFDDMNWHFVDMVHDIIIDDDVDVAATLDLMVRFYENLSLANKTVSCEVMVNARYSDTLPGILTGYGFEEAFNYFVRSNRITFYS